jgi:hypothetical protein
MGWLLPNSFWQPTRFRRLVGVADSRATDRRRAADENVGGSQNFLKPLELSLVALSTLGQEPLPQRLEHEQSQSDHHEIHDRGQYEYQVPTAAR